MAASPLLEGAAVEAAVEPAVDLGAAAVLVDGLHQDVGLRIRRADGGGSAYAVVAGRKRRGVQRRWKAPARRIGAGGLGRMPVFPVRAGETGEEGFGSFSGGSCGEG